MEEKNKSQATVFKVTYNGPLHVSGNFILLDESAKQLDIRGETWLCRCGISKTKPFCDGSHRKEGVKD